MYLNSGNVSYLHSPLSAQGFFRSLFTSGFIESSPRLGGGPHEIVVQFDDHNITRAGTICYFLCTNYLLNRP